MDNEQKILRFVNFLDQTIEKTACDICDKVFINYKDQKLSVKIRIKDIGLIRYVNFTKGSYSISKSSAEKLDCIMQFSKAAVLHQLLIGKMLPFNLDLVGKASFIFFSEKGKIISSAYIPAKKNYCEIVKGTRFTLKNPEDK